LDITKDLGDNARFLASTLCVVLQLWVTLLVSAARNPE
jgi:hypothetical protein